jgi:hypothetical protein
MDLQSCMKGLELLQTITKLIPTAGPMLEALVDVPQKSCEIAQVSLSSLFSNALSKQGTTLVCYDKQG